MSCICALRCILVFINTIFGIISAFITVIGGIYTWGEKSVQNSFNAYLLDGISTLNNKKALPKILLKVLEEIQPAGVYIFTVGLIVFIICLFGIIGACCKSRWVICIYMILHISLLIPEATIIIVYYCRPDIVTTFSRDVFNSSIHHYVGYDSSDIHSRVLNYIMTQLQCCGLTNGSDFDSVKTIKRNIVYKGEPYDTLKSIYMGVKDENLIFSKLSQYPLHATDQYTSWSIIEFKYPISCCKMMNKSQEINDDSCPDRFTPENSNVHVGCWQIIEGHVKTFANLFAYTFSGVLGFQIILILFTLIILRTNRKIKPI
uniref:Tetraspanin n=1 Tax=Trichobilharzia regenti TaxID=157069 RepID=A0AA85J6W1_TRIRE|nr:unnamed protein product [Trichobilharzia regenti]